jgi:hypothetical protein
MSTPLSRARETLKDALEQYISLLGVDAPLIMMEDSKRFIADRTSAQNSLLQSLMRSSTSSAGGKIASSSSKLSGKNAATPVAVAVAAAVLKEPSPAPARGGAGGPSAPPTSNVAWGDVPEASTLEGWITSPTRGKASIIPIWGTASPAREKTFATAAAAAAPLVAKSAGGNIKTPTSWKEYIAIHFTDYKSAHLGFKKLSKFNARVLERRPLSEMHDSVFEGDDGFEDHIKSLSDEKFQELLKDTTPTGAIVTKVTELCPLFIDEHMKPMSAVNLDYVLHNGLGRFIWPEYDVDKFVYPATLRAFFKIPAGEAPSELQLRKTAILDAIQTYMLKGTIRLLQKLQAEHPGTFTICQHPQWSYTPFALNFKTKEDRVELMNYIMNGM